MSRVLAIGPETLLAGYAVAGVEVVPASDEAAAQRAWDALPADVDLVILAPVALAGLTDRLRERPRVLWAALP